MAEVTEKNQKLARICFSLFFLAGLFYSMFQTERVDFFKNGECLRDVTFEWTTFMNDYLHDHRDIKKRYIIFASFLMDCMLISFMLLFFFYWRSYRVILAYAMFFSLRAWIQVSFLILYLSIFQNVFFMRRVDKWFLFEPPGFHSITVPYHDSNDFFYSGHVGTCFLLFREYRTSKWHRMSYFTFFVLVN